MKKVAKRILTDKSARSKKEVGKLLLTDTAETLAWGGIE
jgi:hypothetical protein